MKSWKIALGVLLILALACIIASVWFMDSLYQSRGEEWTYTSADKKLTMQLPSGYWRAGKSRDSDVFAAFHDAAHGGVITVHVAMQTNADYEAKTLPIMRKYLDDSREELLSDPVVTVSETKNGDTITCWKMKAKTEQGDGAVFNGFALIYSKEKQMAIKIMMEGPLKMASKYAGAKEWDYFNEVADFVFFSAK